MRNLAVCSLALVLPLACTEAPLSPTTESADGAVPDEASPPDGIPPDDEPAPPASETPACEVGASVDPLVVATTRGLVKGQDDDDGVVRFLGIPYAKPPVGSLRFRSPEEAACFSGVREAFDFGAMCPQAGLTDPDEVVGEEDCLSLNVWTPALPDDDDDDAPRPVLFWIHGGANLMGASGQELMGHAMYDGARLAKSRDVVVISANYRLGALGFMAHESFRAESEHGVSGNWGILDLVAALEWVQDNAASFGGDAARVMVFGESAGAYNTCALVASPLAAGLFSSALMQSGVCEFATSEQAHAFGDVVASELGCDVDDAAACLRSVPTEKLVQAIPALTLGVTPLVGQPGFDVTRPLPLPFGTHVDGWLLPRAPLAMMRDGEHNRVPFVVGSNKDEMALFMLQDAGPYTCGEAEDLVEQAFLEHAGDVLARYSCSAWKPRQLIVDILTDVFFTCPARRIARAASGHGVDVYRYSFEYVNPFSPTAGMGAYHAAEIPFVFQDAAANPLALSSERALSVEMGGYWARFSDGDPNGGDALLWEPYDVARDNALVLDAPLEVAEHIDEAECDYWDSFVVDDG